MAYTTGYGAVMPAYSQPMMSSVEMSHDDMANQQSINGSHVTSCGDEYVAGVDTDYTVAVAEDYYAADTFVPVSDTAGSQSPIDVCLNEDNAAAAGMVNCCSL